MESATCIVALSYNGKVWIGGDAAATEDTSLRILRNEKVFKITDANKHVWLFGFSGTYRFAQLLQYKLVLPEITPEDEADLLRFMVVKFVPALQQCLRDGLFEQLEKNRAIGGFCIICLHGRIFSIGNQYSVQENAYPYDALGCGSAFALGSVYGSEQLHPKARITLALSAAEKFCSAVQGPFTILHS